MTSEQAVKRVQAWIDTGILVDQGVAQTVIDALSQTQSALEQSIAECAKLEACCAEMRGIIEAHLKLDPTAWDRTDHALSSTCGTTFLAERERLRALLALILPLAKGYVARNDVGNNRKFIEEAEEALKETAP